MRINNNIMAMNTHRQYTINTNSVSKSMEKLSSGYRVNRAGDDAAGLAISEKMRAQIRGLQMASKNSSDAISLVQTAEGALQESHNILQRMRELAVQSSSDTNETSIDRAALNAEFKQLIAELDDTADKAKFNDMGVIDGTFGASVEIDVAYDMDEAIFQADYIIMASEKLATENGSAITFDGTDEFELSNDGETYKGKLSENGLKKGAHTVQFEDGTTFSYTLLEDTDLTDFTDALDGGGTSGDGVIFNVTEAKPLTIQSGANQGDELEISIDKMNSAVLGLRKSDHANTVNTEDVNIADREAASKAITATNLALNLVSSQRSKLGALQNRLTHKISNLDTSAENLSAAESRIRDLDMAWEMTNFTRNNILTQASTAMLAQANVAPQGVLSLLG